MLCPTRIYGSSMPIYEYLCTNCKHQFEELQTMSEEQLKTCPKCGKDTLKKLIGAGTGVIFKGSGFYLTDYKKADKQKPAAKKEETSKKGDTSDVKGETFPQSRTKSEKESKETKKENKKEDKSKS
jgi:putative FmdB family regulatory protein